MLLQHSNPELYDSIIGSDTGSTSHYTPSASYTSSQDSHSWNYSFYDSQGWRYSSHESFLDHLDRLDCTLCNPLRFRDDSIACAQEHHFPSIPYLESEHVDFRASSRAKQRQRKIRENKSGCNSYRCRKMKQARQDTRNLKKKRDGLKWAVRESKRDVSCITRSYGKKARHCSVEWDTKLEEEMDEHIYDSEDDIVRYITVHHGADTFRSEEPYVETVETFSAWCQRRIAEMRDVREDRMRRAEPKSTKQMVWKREHDWQYGRGYDVFTGDETTTTLPAIAYDALGHELLRVALEPGTWWTKQQRISNVSLFRPVCVHRWFGEFEWAWQRDISGCWEIGYENCRICREHRTDQSISCLRCCAVSGSVYYEKFCREGPYFAAPEDTQRCCLDEWVDEEGRNIIRLEQAEQEAKIEYLDDDAGSCESESSRGWEEISSMSSETWSVVDI